MKYHTAQRERLSSFIKESPNRQFTIDDLENALSDVSKATIYRNVNQLVEDGVIRRFEKEGSRKFLYQYMGNAECNEHFHIACSECGEVIHMDHEASESLINVFKNMTSFNLDASKTMIIGHCSGCE